MVHLHRIITFKENLRGVRRPTEKLEYERREPDIDAAAGIDQ